MAGADAYGCFYEYAGRWTLVSRSPSLGGRPSASPMSMPPDRGAGTGCTASPLSPARGWFLCVLPGGEERLKADIEATVLGWRGLGLNVEVFELGPQVP
ncbi:hypothetical protein CVT26_012333 [Gymnopilus dilepis]|uniref:Uncharacterized protein n=1 Tax=Gymnopilus dilepis TaxID=231916 RepID=A0A409X5M7_9AGAR|nr:hypothetical protein CVT26_012333 [Gymnopilus dilepis]